MAETQNYPTNGLQPPMEPTATDSQSAIQATGLQPSPTPPPVEPKVEQQPQTTTTAVSGLQPVQTPPPVQQQAPAPTTPPPTTTPTVTGLQPPKTPTTKISQAQDMQQGSLDYVQGVMQGEDPISAKAWDDMLKSTNAQGQKLMDATIQQLAATGQLGQGSGNALLSQMARDYNTNVANIKSRMTDSMLKRVEQFNQLGYELGKDVETRQKKLLENNIAKLLENGQFAEATAESAKLAEAFGTEAVDFNNPDSIVKWETDKKKYDELRKDLEDRYSQGLLSYEQFAEEWRKATNNDPSFARFAGDIPSESFVVKEKESRAQQAIQDNLFRTMTDLVSRGQVDGAANLMKGMFEEGGSLEGLADPDAVLQTFRDSTDAGKAALTNSIGMIDSLLKENDTESAWQLAQDLIATHPENPELASLFGDKFKFDAYADAAQVEFRNLQKQEANNIMDSYLEIGSTMTETQQAEAFNNWSMAYQNSKTEHELQQDLQSWFEAKYGPDAGLPDADDMQEFLQDKWKDISNLSDPENIQRAEVNRLANSMGEALGMEEGVEKDTLVRYLNESYVGITNGEIPSIDTFLENPDNYLTFYDFNGDLLDRENGIYGDDYRREKTVWDAYAQTAKAEGLELINPREFHDKYVEFGGNVTDIVDSTRGEEVSAALESVPQEALSVIQNPDSDQRTINGTLRSLTPEQIFAVEQANPGTVENIDSVISSDGSSMDVLYGNAIDGVNSIDTPDVAGKQGLANTLNLHTKAINSTPVIATLNGVEMVGLPSYVGQYKDGPLYKYTFTAPPGEDPKLNFEYYIAR